MQVGGHVWIDKNADGEWQADESVSQLTDNALVQSLLNHVEITLYTYEGRSDMVRCTGTRNIKVGTRNIKLKSLEKPLERLN